VRWFSLLVTSGLLAASPLLAKSDEWPKWLGPNGDGISHEQITDHWPAGGPRKVWERKVGYGFSSPIGFEGRVYLFAQQGRNDTLTAFDAETGNVVWSQSYVGTIPADMTQAKNASNGLPLPLATPAIDNGRIYSYGGGGDLVCRKLADGGEVWHTNVLKETGAQILAWNEASSPLVTEKFVYVQGGRNGPTAVAVDKATGKIAWNSEAHTIGGYAAPIIADVDGTKQLIIFAGDALYGMNPDTGRTIWGTPWQTDFNVNASTPIYRDHHLFISSDYDRGAMMLTLSPTGAKEDFKEADKAIALRFQPAILDGQYLYCNSAGTLKCANWPDLKMQWENRLRLGDGGTIVRAGDLLITLSERGKLGLVRATPLGAQVLSQVPLFDFGTTWSMPLIYHGKLYAMGADTLVCLDLGARTASASDHSDAALSQASKNC
jgi:outer membrane protein assembly factor BamB